MIAQLDKAAVRAAPGRAAARLATYALFEGRPLTTRGRWINPLVFAHLHMAARSFPARADQKPIFIVGMGRSGTTLLGRLLGLHPEVGFLNEPKALWHVIHPGEDIIGNYAAEVGRLRLDAADATPQVKRRARALFHYYSRATRSARVVDKYPELIFRVGFVRAIFPDATFIVIVRRSEDVVQSVAEWSRKHGSADADWWGRGSAKWRVMLGEEVPKHPDIAELVQGAGLNASDHVLRASTEWLVTMRAACLLKTSPRCVLLRYEDLVRNPRAVLTALFDECDLARSEVVVRYAEEQVRRSAPAVVAPPAIPAGLQGLIEGTMQDLGYRS